MVKNSIGTRYRWNLFWQRMISDDSKINMIIKL